MKISNFMRQFLFGKRIKQKIIYFIVGLLLFKVAKSCSTLFIFFYQSFLRNPKNLLERYGSDSWAIVTGSGDGLGKGFCLELASRGFNLVLISRNYDKNNEVIKELKLINRNILTMNIPIDFKEANSQIFFDNLFEKLNHLDISILVNNVGKYDLDHFETQNEKEIHEILAINCFPIVLLTRKLIPFMLERNPKSAIINISSLISIKPCPYMAVFAASKAFSDHLSLALAKEENINKKIDVLSLKVFQVSTNMLKKQKGFWILDIRECADACLEKLGFEISTCGHWKHEIINWIYQSLPEGLRVSFFNNTMKKNDEFSQIN